MGETVEGQRRGRCRFNAIAFVLLIGTIEVVCLFVLAAYLLFQALYTLVYPLLSMLMAVQ